ncbi:hypothetical protein C8R45DRAFT_1165313 [Mycena sanguinolenta]|nr:hypothetical protein C8R45DRAFT_1165313 [Mycena sanguinolenta]
MSPEPCLAAALRWRSPTRAPQCLAVDGGEDEVRASAHLGVDSIANRLPRSSVSPARGTYWWLDAAVQLAFQDRKMGMLVHFEIATHPSIDGCNGVPGLVLNPTLFDPTLLNTDQWMSSIIASSAQ